jgi:hypothetical protein
MEQESRGYRRMRADRDIGAERHSQLTEHTGRTGLTDDGPFLFQGNAGIRRFPDRSVYERM